MAVEQFPRRAVERPHTSINVDTSGIGGASSGSDKLVMLIGAATGGQPDTVYKVRNYVQAKEIFRSGELLDAMELAWNPSSNASGAGDILAMRIEDATPATLTKGPLKFTSKLFGQEANEIQIAYGKNPINQSGRLTVTFSPDRYNQVYDNLGDILTVRYTGEAKYAAVEVVGASGAQTLNLYAGEDAEAAALAKSYPLGKGAYKEAHVLANDISGISGFEARMATTGDKNIDTAGLDPIAKTEVKAEEVKLTGLVADIIKQLEYDNYLTVESTGSGSLVDFTTTSLAGGAEGTTPESWATKLVKFSNEGGYYLVPLTDKAAVHAEALAFVNDRSANGDPMRIIVGSGYNESADKLLNRATALRDARAMLTGISGIRNLDDGRKVQIPGYMYAAQIAGLASGLPIGEAITYKNLNITELATTFEGVQLDMLNSGGVVMAEFVRNRMDTNFRIVDDVTTYNDASDPVRNEMAVGEANDFLVSELKIKLDNEFIGNKVVDISASLIKNSIQSFLDQKKRDQEIQNYAPEEVQVVINGDTVSISLVIFPVRSIKRIVVSLVYRQQTLTA